MAAVFGHIFGCFFGKTPRFVKSALLGGFLAVFWQILGHTPPLPKTAISGGGSGPVFQLFSFFGWRVAIVYEKAWF